MMSIVLEIKKLLKFTILWDRYLDFIHMIKIVSDVGIFLHLYKYLSFLLAHVYNIQQSIHHYGVLLHFIFISLSSTNC